MIRNYFVIAWRNLVNNLFFSGINVIGLSIGMACCLVMGLFSINQYSYDKHHQNADRIYRVVNRQTEGNNSTSVAMTQGVLAPELIKSFKEVEAATRVGFMQTGLTLFDQELLGERIMAVDSSFFSIFTIPFKQNPVGGTIARNGILISEPAAVRLFGDKNPMGETISLGNQIHLTVTGVFRNFPIESHLFADFIVSFSWIEQNEPNTQSWSSNAYYNYVLMPARFDLPVFNKKMDEFIHQFTPASWKEYNYYLQPLRVISLQAGYMGNPKGSIGIIVVNGFIVVSLIILILATFNYMNMATARSTRRSLEVGVRKVVGASRRQLVGQFLVESLILCSLGFLLAVLWADFGTQYFNYYTGFNLSLATFFKDPVILFWLIGSLLVLSVFAGAYPAFFLSRFVPAAVLKGQRSTDSGRRLRRGLVIFQFSLTSLLVVLAIVVFKQMNFMSSINLGYNKENVLLFTGDRNKEIGLESFKAELLKIPGVKQISNASSFPNSRQNATSIWENGKQEDESFRSLWLYADHDYIPTLDLKLLAGRNFDSNGKDKGRGAIINEYSAATFGWTPEEAIGKRLSGFVFGDSTPGEVIGVIKDFHISPLRKAIMPLIIIYTTEQANYMVRLEGKNLVKTRQKVDQVSANLVHGNKVESYFMEEAIEESYGVEQKTGAILSFFTILAIVIGCTGLYALSVYEGERRIKELGIRKIMGASTRKLLLLLSENFLKLIALSLFVSMPLAYLLGNVWLRSYPYRISWSVDIFLISSALVVLLGWSTILTQALKASRLNPVESLKYE